MSIWKLKINANILKKKGRGQNVPPFSPRKYNNYLLHIVLHYIFLHLIPYIVYNHKQLNYLLDMTTEEEFVKHYEAGRPTLYDEKKHIRLLYKVFANQESIYAYVDEALITRQTFYNWLKTHEKFKEAYDVALCIGARQFEKYPQLKPEHFNFPYWSTVMKNRYQYYKTRIEIKPNDTPKNRIEAVWEGVSSGELSTQEASQLASLAVTQANIENGTTDDTSNNIRQFTNDQLKERLELVNSLIDKK